MHWGDACESEEWSTAGQGSALLVGRILLLYVTSLARQPALPSARDGFEMVTFRRVNVVYINVNILLTAC